MRNLSWCRHGSWLFFPWLLWALHAWKQKKESCGEDECYREDLARRSTVDFEGQGVAVMERRSMMHDL